MYVGMRIGRLEIDKDGNILHADFSLPERVKNIREIEGLEERLQELKKRYGGIKVTSAKNVFFEGYQLDIKLKWEDEQYRGALVEVRKPLFPALVSKEFTAEVPVNGNVLELILDDELKQRRVTLKLIEDNADILPLFIAYTEQNAYVDIHFERRFRDFSESTLIKVAKLIRYLREKGRKFRITPDYLLGYLFVKRLRSLTKESLVTSPDLEGEGRTRIAISKEELYTRAFTLDDKAYIDPFIVKEAVKNLENELLTPEQLLKLKGSEYRKTARSIYKRILSKYNALCAKKIKELQADEKEVKEVKDKGCPVELWWVCGENHSFVIREPADSVDKHHKKVEMKIVFKE